MDQSRRSFLKATGAAAAAVAAVPAALKAAEGDTSTAAKPETVNTQIASPKNLPYLSGPMQGEVRKGDMVYRPLGSTGEMVSLIGLGGWHIGKPNSEADAIRLVHDAVDHGINFMDNCWDYNLGISELRAGKAYKGHFHGGRAHGGRPRRQEAGQGALHRLYRPQGPARAPADARGRQGARFSLRRGADAHQRSRRALPLVRRAGAAGARAGKDCATGHENLRRFSRPQYQQPLGVTPIEMLHFSMNLPVSVVITGIEKQEILDQASEAVRIYKPLDGQAIAALLDKTRVPGSKGVAEHYKTTWDYDGTTQNPHWLGLKANVPAG